MNGKIISGPAAILILLLFFLPWISVSCGGAQIGEFSGYQLASNTDGDPLFFFIPLAGIVSLILLASTLWKPTLETNANWGLIITPSLSLVVLLLKWFQFQGQDDGTFDVTILPALWLTIIALIAMVLGSVYDLFRPPKKPQPSAAMYGAREVRQMPRQPAVEQPEPRQKSNLVDKNTMVDDDPIVDKSKSTVVDDDPKPVGKSRETIVDDEYSPQDEADFFRRVSEDSKTEPFTESNKPPAGPLKRVDKTEVLDLEPELKAWLVIGNGERKGERFKLMTEMTVGRDPNSDIFINDTALSALHLRVKFFNGRFVAYDQNSTNGLFVFDLNKERWERKEQVLLQEGTRIKLGRTILVFMSLSPDKH